MKLPAPPQQLSLELEFRPDREEIVRRLREQDRALGTLLPPPVELRVRRNRSTLGSLRLSPGPEAVWRFTVDADLLAANPRGVLDLGLLLLHRARRRRPPRELIQSLGEIRRGWGAGRPTRPSRRLSPDPVLESLLGEVARAAAPEMAAEDLPAVGWVDSASRRVLGRFDLRARRIEIHAALRDPSVPRVVLENLLHHELLHALLGSRQQGGRTVHHHRDFRERERGYPGYRESLEWERRHWPACLRRHMSRQSRAAA
jgi:hypothetical protein